VKKSVENINIVTDKVVTSFNTFRDGAKKLAEPVKKLVEENHRHNKPFQD